MSELLYLGKYLSSKQYVNSKSGIAFPSPSEIWEPMSRVMEELEFGATDYTVQLDAKSEINEPGTDMVYNAYGKGMIIARRETAGNAFYDSIGIIFDYSTGRPLAKVFSGLEVRACLNMTIFNAERIFTQDLVTNGIRELFPRLGIFLTTKEKDNKYIETQCQMMKEAVLSRAQLHTVIGEVRERTIRSNGLLGLNILSQAEQLLYNEKSRYYVGPENDAGATTLWNVFNAITDTIGDDTNFIKMPGRVLQAAQILEPYYTGK